jgi:predicted ATPase/DNA-binding CsgD family transcriptional regulator
MRAGLSGREEEVLALVAQGLSNAQVAARLGISPLTVKKHLERMYDASGVRNRAELVARTYERTESPSEPTGLPAALTSFIGRERELAEVQWLLEKHRLVTLGGPGGIGKTRLATVVATSASDRFAHGVHLIELASLSAQRQLAHAVASALGIPERQGSRTAAIVTALRGKRKLLILDNCEHVVASVAELVAEVLRGCAEVRVLATSREALCVRGEMFWPVPPLTLPEPEKSRVVDVAQSEAVRLFIERAALRVADFDLTAANARAVGAICRALDGLPLAIELAAARMNVLSVDEIRVRLDDRFRELRTDATEVTARHRTLRSVIEWSYQLLSPAEALLFDRLSVFTGGFTLAAATAVCSGAGVERERVLELLARLVDRSFVIADVRRSETRYRMLETLQRYAAERLVGRGDPDLARRHAEHFCGFAERAEPELRGTSQIEWFDRLDADHDNLRAALAWSFEHDVTLGARIASALWRYWFHRGHLHEARRWLDLAVALDGLPPRLRGKVLNAAGNVAGSAGELGRSEALHRESLQLQRSRPDAEAWELTAAMSNLGDRLRERGAVDEARALFTEALVLRAPDDHWGRALSTSQLGHVLLDEGQLDAARLLYLEALRLWRRAGDRVRAAHVLTFIARLDREEGRHRRAHDLYRRALVMFRGFGDRFAMARTLALMSLNLEASGDHREARRLYAGSAVGHRETETDFASEPVDLTLIRRVHDGLVSIGAPYNGLRPAGALEDEAEFASLDAAVVYAIALRSELGRTAYSRTT